jgi:hypothetical protein
LTEQKFNKLLHTDREAAIAAILNDFVQRCRNDGPDEMVRVLTVWATRSDRCHTPQLDLGDDGALLEHARHFGTVEVQTAEAGSGELHTWGKAHGVWHLIAQITGPPYQLTRTCQTKCGRMVEAGARTLIDLPQSRKPGRRLCPACAAIVTKR